jgi:hypothetical protein
VKKNNWTGLVGAIQKYSTISQGELHALARRFVKVDIHYIAKRFERRGIED